MLSVCVEWPSLGFAQGDLFMQELLPSSERHCGTTWNSERRFNKFVGIHKTMVLYCLSYFCCTMAHRQRFPQSRGLQRHTLHIKQNLFGKMWKNCFVFIGEYCFPTKTISCQASKNELRVQGNSREHSQRLRLYLNIRGHTYYHRLSCNNSRVLYECTLKHCDTFQGRQLKQRSFFL